MADARKFDLKLFEATIGKMFGSEALTTLDGQAVRGGPGTFIPSSSESLNTAIGIGGLPRGRVVEIFGPESGGKTTLALDFCAHAQRLYPKLPVMYIDTEHAFDVEYARLLGVDIGKSRFILAQPSCAEEALEIAYEAAKAGACMIVVDSVPAMSLKKDLEEHLSTEERVGGKAKVLRNHLSRMIGVLEETDGIAIYINHITYKVGVVYGSPEQVGGGTGLKFFASVRIDVRTKEQLQADGADDPHGIRCKAKVVKNKVAPPFRKAEYDIIFGEGIDRISGLLDAAIAAEVVTKSGSWFSLGDERIGQGRESVKARLKKEPEFEARVRKALESCRNK
jgi:recombination protein RecA